MAENTREIRYYKGVPYNVIMEQGDLIQLGDITNPQVQKLVERKNTYTQEEFDKLKESRRSPHVMNIPK